MNITIELPDLDTFLESEFEGEEFSTRSVEERFVELALKRLTEEIYERYVWNGKLREIDKDVSFKIGNFLADNKDDIISQTSDKVADRIEKKKEMLAMMPKKKDFSDIDKEWEDYFMKMIDKAIAKRFK